MRHGAFVFVAIVALPSLARAQGLTGRWILSPSTVTFNATKSVGQCPQRPPRESGATIQVTEEGGELAFSMPDGRRTTASCWTDNAEVGRRGHTKGPPRWSTSCATGADNPKVERGTYTFSVSEDGLTISMRLQTTYAISVAGSECEGSFTVSRSLRSTNAPAPVAEGAAPPADRCKTPGAPARIELAARRRVAPGSRACLPAKLRDSNGCDAAGTLDWTLVSGNAQVDGPCVRVPSDAARGDRIRVAATVGALRAEATLEVASAEEAEEDMTALLARDPVDRREQDDGRRPGGEGAGGVRAMSPTPGHGQDLLWPILVIAALLLVVLAMVLLLVVRTQRRRDEPLPRETSPPSKVVASARPHGNADAPVVCPTCREEFKAGSQFCPYDATALIPAGSEPERPTLGAICPRCHRGYEAGTARCATDGEDLVPYPIHQIARPRHAGVGESGKICPTCSARYDLEATFCGKDGSELVLVN